MAEADSKPDAKPLPQLGSYQLSRQLGSGGMSNVFRAVHLESGNVVAVKVLPRSLAKNPTLLQRFLREAKSAEALDHAHIVQIFDRGFDQGRHYLVLEFVEGRDLHDRIRLNGPMPIDEAIRLVREVAEGLHYAAGRGMIHRDIKPANLLITPEGHAKIIDLGLALQTEDEDERVTRDGTTVGTVDYMSPEQARDSRKTSDRSDIYSLGCTFFYLLTGSPPYPGGGLADKLARHYTAPIPDVRERRPEVPEPVALLIQKMMAKKPERRFADYPHLITALDALATSLVPGATPLVALFADDDDEDDPPLSLASTLSSVGGQGRGDSSHPPTVAYDTAEIVDDDDDDLDEPMPSSHSRSVSGRPAEISLAELAALDGAEHEPASRKSRRPQSAPTQATPVTNPSLDSLLDEEDEPVMGGGGPIRHPRAELSLKTWIAAGALVGLAIALVGVGVSLVISLAKPDQPEVVTQPVLTPPPHEDNETVGPTPPVRPASIRPGPVPPPIVTSKTKVPPKSVPQSPVPVPDLVASPAVERIYPSEWTDRLQPPTSQSETIAAERPRFVVRRVADGSEEASGPSLALGLGRPGDLVEMADMGPFFEDDFQTIGKTVQVRARPGFRPIIKVEQTELANVREQEAKFVLGGTRTEQLVLEGLDLVVDLRDLPGHQSALFVCRGAALTLRDCTVTVYNAGSRKFALFKLLDGPRPNRLILERTAIRGPVRTLVELTASRAEIVLDRTLLLGDLGPVIAVDSVDKPSRSLFLTRSVVATRGPLIEWSGKPCPMALRVLGSTFARVEGGAPAGLMQTRGVFASESRSWLDWAGEDNSFIGWQASLTSGAEGSIRLANLDALRQAWPGTDSTSREVSHPWPASAIRDDVGLADLEALAPERRAVLARIATPHPKLRELTIDPMKRLFVPGLAKPAGGSTGSGTITAPPEAYRVPTPTAAGGPLGSTTNSVGKSAAPAKPTSQPTLGVDQTFDLQAAPWQGDLGRFLAERAVSPGARLVVHVRGEGLHATSPIRLPERASISIVGEWTVGSKTPMPGFFAAPGSAGKTMLDLRGGVLELTNLVFSAEGSVRPRHWVRSEDGILVIRRCWFRDRGGADPEVGPMIAFVAAGTAPIPPRADSPLGATDFPTARVFDTVIWTGGDAISTEVGRGVVDLENCLVISGGPAVMLSPSKVPREKFEADLIMENCTIADERTALQLGPWPGDPAGPTRPWLVSTRACIFPKTQRDGSGAMLQVDPAAFARGVLFWQSYADAYEIGRFLAPSGVQHSGPVPAVDFKKQWAGLWGGRHTRADRGPDPHRNDHVLRFKENIRPKAGKLTPASLELDSTVGSAKDLGVRFKDLPPPPLPR